MSKSRVKSPSPEKLVRVEDAFSPDITRAIQRVVEEIEVAPEPTRLESPQWRFGAGLIALLTPGCVGIFAKLGPDLFRQGNHCAAHDTHAARRSRETSRPRPASGTGRAILGEPSRPFGAPRSQKRPSLVVFERLSAPPESRRS